MDLEVDLGLDGDTGEVVLGELGEAGQETSAILVDVLMVGLPLELGLDGSGGEACTCEMVKD